MTDKPREYGDKFFWTIRAERYEEQLASAVTVMAAPHFSKRWKSAGEKRGS
jgi:hypothetical protein